MRNKIITDYRSEAVAKETAICCECDPCVSVQLPSSSSNVLLTISRESSFSANLSLSISWNTNSMKNNANEEEDGED
ncbi:hypothetical protein LINPERHAP1_LOCUS31647 [Linum perenne]